MESKNLSQVDFAGRICTKDFKRIPKVYSPQEISLNNFYIQINSNSRVDLKSKAILEARLANFGEILPITLHLSENEIIFIDASTQATYTSRFHHENSRGERYYQGELTYPQGLHRKPQNFVMCSRS